MLRLALLPVKDSTLTFTFWPLLTTSATLAMRPSLRNSEMCTRPSQRFLPKHTRDEVYAYKHRSWKMTATRRLKLTNLRPSSCTKQPNCMRLLILPLKMSPTTGSSGTVRSTTVSSAPQSFLCGLGGWSLQRDALFLLRFWAASPSRSLDLERDRLRSSSLAVFRPRLMCKGI